MNDEIDLTTILRAARQSAPGDFKAQTAWLIKFYERPCNEHGVFENCEEVELAREGRSWAVAKVIKASENIWLAEYSSGHAIGGTYSPVTVWSRTGYPTREQAVMAVSRKAADEARGLSAYQLSPMTQAMRDEAAKIVAALARPVLPQQVQLDMFA